MQVPRYEIAFSLESNPRFKTGFDDLSYSGLVSMRVLLGVMVSKL